MDRTKYDPAELERISHPNATIRPLNRNKLIEQSSDFDWIKNEGEDDETQI